MENDAALKRLTNTMMIKESELLKFSHENQNL